jgi:hypothetical protein
MSSISAILPSGADLATSSSPGAAAERHHSLARSGAGRDRVDRDPVRPELDGQ